MWDHIECATGRRPIWVGGCDGIGGLAYLLFCAAYWSRKPRVFRHLSRSCFELSYKRCFHNECNWKGKRVNSLRPRQNRRHFADDVLNCNFLNENVWIPIKISLKFVPKGPINNIPALVKIMAWCRTGDKPLSEPMVTQFNDAYMRHSASMS